MLSPLGAVAHGEPATLPMGASTRAALQVLERTGSGLVVLADEERRIPVGIFTQRDALRRVALEGASLDDPVACVMTSGLVTLGPTATAHQALLAMTRHRVRRVVIVDDAGRLLGLVSQEELLGLARAGVDEISAAIQAAGDVEALRRAAQDVRRAGLRLLAQDVGAEAVAHSISTLHDLLTIRLLELIGDRFDLPPVPFCWIALGSEGRLEQTFVTDQDNAIVFSAEECDVQQVRDALLPYARAVNDALDACGFPSCAGGIMSGNPRWCLTANEWRRTFARWIDEPDPQALLHATIFFDLRPVHGAAGLAEGLRSWLLAEAPRRPLFLRLLAEHALACTPPLGIFRDFVLDRSREHRGTIDLKKHGSRPFVDAARAFALQHGVPHTNTAERLRALAGVLPIPGVKLEAIVDAFHFVHRLRLRTQCASDAAEARTNHLDPRTLGELDRQLLKEAFRQASLLQRLLAAEHALV